MCTVCTYRYIYIYIRHVCRPLSQVVLSSSCGIEGQKIIHYKPLLDEAIELAEFKPQSCLIHQRPQERAELVPGRDVDWAEAVAAAPLQPCVPVGANDPLYIL